MEGCGLYQKGEKLMASEDDLVSELSQISYGTLSFICGGKKKRKREGKMILNEKSGFLKLGRVPDVSTDVQR